MIGILGWPKSLSASQRKMGSHGMFFSIFLWKIHATEHYAVTEGVKLWDICVFIFKKILFFYFQTTQRLEWYADSFAKASRLDFKPEIIHWDQNQILYSLRSICRDQNQSRNLIKMCLMSFFLRSNFWFKESICLKISCIHQL